MRPVIWPAFAVVLITFGVMSLHYTMGDEYLERTKWAESRGMPPPSLTIFIMGAACVLVGGAIVGWFVRSRGLGRRASG